MNNIGFNENGYYIQYLDDSEFENFDEIVRESFLEICCGYCNCDTSDVQEIAQEFLKRIGKKSKKDNRRRVGFIGELLYYIFAKYKFPFLKEINPMLNVEERSYKKGFDMISELDNEIWYSEVKSGEHKSSTSKSINKMNIEKIDNAYSDLNNKLNFSNRNYNYWITAKFKLRNCIEEKDEVKRLAKILNLDKTVKRISNKIVVSVIFGTNPEKINEAKVVEKLNKIRKQDEKVIIVCIRESTLNRTISIIEELADNG